MWRDTYAVLAEEFCAARVQLYYSSRWHGQRDGPRSGAPINWQPGVSDRNAKSNTAASWILITESGKCLILSPSCRG
jgi:hypothetical protein